MSSVTDIFKMSVVSKNFPTSMLHSVDAASSLDGEYQVRLIVY
jgi:hypothetical protein